MVIQDNPNDADALFDRGSVGIDTVGRKAELIDNSQPMRIKITAYASIRKGLIQRKSQSAPAHRATTACGPAVSNLS
jgi:hypothetical protein